MTGFALMIPCQTAGFHEPAKGAFHHPALWEQLKALDLIAAFNDFQSQAAVAEAGPHLPHPLFWFSLIAAVGKDQGHAQKTNGRTDKTDPWPIPVLHAGRTGLDARQQPVKCRSGDGVCAL